jgi:hypothetical protein
MDRVAWRLLAVTVACVLATSGCGDSKSDSTTSSKPDSKPAEPSWALHGAYAPTIDATKFVDVIDNRFFPLIPGTAFHFKGTADGVAQTDDMVVTRQVKVVQGVHCTVVEDTVSEHGREIERTADWYAQDADGNVWYMGEDSFERDDRGKFVRADDSWESGVNHAEPGIIMPGDPKVGSVYRQEYYPQGKALDQARVMRNDAHQSVTYGTYDHVLVTVEWSPVEPQLEQKSYVAGVGEIEEHVTAGGHEAFQLVRITHE